MNVKRGRTSQIIPIRILDITSVSGGGKTGLVWNSANLTAYFKRELDATATAITLATMTAGTWATGGFVEEDATHLAGQYSLGLPNAALGSSDASTWVEVMLYDSSTGLGISPFVLRIDLVAYDPQDATRGGLTALPNAAAEAAGGLYTRGSGAGQINQPGNGLIDVSLKAILNTVLTETSGLIAAGFKKFFNIASPTSTMNEITLVDTATTLTNAPPDSSGVTTLLSRIASAITVSGGAVNANITAITSGIIVAASFASGALDAVWSTAARTLTAFGFNVTLTSGEHTAISNTDVPAGLTAQGYTAARAGYLDVLNGIVAAVQSGLATIANQVTTNNNVLGVSAAVWAYVSRTLTSASGPTVQQIVNGVWDESNASHVQAGSTGLNLNNAGSGASPSTIAAAVWAYVLAAPTTAAQVLLSILAKVNLIGSGILFSSVPVAPSGATTITAGSSYYAADGLALIYTLSGYPDLDVGTANAEWHAVNKNNKPVVIVGNTIAVNQLRFELSSAQSAPLDSGSFSLKGSIAGSQHTLKTPNSKLTVLPSL